MHSIQKILTFTKWNSKSYLMLISEDKWAQFQQMMYFYLCENNARSSVCWWYREETESCFPRILFAKIALRFYVPEVRFSHQDHVRVFMYMVVGFSWDCAQFFMSLVAGFSLRSHIDLFPPSFWIICISEILSQAKILATYSVNVYNVHSHPRWQAI